MHAQKNCGMAKLRKSMSIKIVFLFRNVPQHEMLHSVASEPICLFVTVDQNDYKTANILIKSSILVFG